MNTEMNGRKIKMFRGMDNHGNPYVATVGSQKMNWRLGEDEDLTTGIYLSATHHGQYDEFWVVQVFDKKEIYHNPKSLDHIEFAE